MSLTYVGNRLTLGQKLLRNQALLSPNQWYALVMQEDGNLVLYPIGSIKAFLASGTNGHSVAWAQLQADGNFSISSISGAQIWSSNTQGNDVAWLALQDDGNLVIYNSNGETPWATNTSTAPGGRIRDKIRIEHDENGTGANGDGNLSDFGFENQSPLPVQIQGPGTLQIDVPVGESGHIKPNTAGSRVTIQSSREYTLPASSPFTIQLDNIEHTIGDALPAGQKQVLGADGRFSQIEE